MRKTANSFFSLLVAAVSATAVLAQNYVPYEYSGPMVTSYNINSGWNSYVETLHGGATNQFVAGNMTVTNKCTDGKADRVPNFFLLNCRQL